jgi:hypothetical protein
MVKPAQIEIVRRAYQLWQEAGQPDGRDDEFYLQAERELRSKGNSDDTSAEHPVDSNL